ncbi:MAG TPA: MBL fold metallo-hydrolase [Kofleriaceae bacterium]|nr:MBL fold metallo-hydrolase [Kofleriaceae bacterium]
MFARALVLLGVLGVLGVLGGCGAQTPPPARPRAPRPEVPVRLSEPPRPTEPAPPGQAAVTWRRVETAADLPPPPAPGTFQLHLIDVGTGLAILIRGADFAMLYDAGTNDPGEKPLRVAAYLAATLGPSGDDLCVPPGTPLPRARRRLEHVVLSHPHADHASALDLVLHCYDVGHFWDPGRLVQTAFYRDLMAQLARSAPTTYHTAAVVPDDRAVAVKGHRVTIPRWERFSEGDAVPLGAGARFTILHAEPKPSGNPNGSSLVVRVELGGTRVLLVGDAESGARRDPSEPPAGLEAYLIAQHAPALRADILQVGHHGSKTSSRRAFLQAVGPKVALVSSGPRQYSGTTLPDPEVIAALGAVGATILRTDLRDASCPVTGRIGGDAGPGGCDTWVVTIDGRAAGVLDPGP